MILHFSPLFQLCVVLAAVISFFLQMNSLLWTSTAKDSLDKYICVVGKFSGLVIKSVLGEEVISV